MGDIQWVVKRRDGLPSNYLGFEFCTNTQDVLRKSTLPLSRMPLRYANEDLLILLNQTLGFSGRRRLDLTQPRFRSAGHGIPPAPTSQDDSQQSPDGSHLFGAVLWIDLFRTDGVRCQLGATAKPVRYLAPFHGIEEVVDIDVDRMESLLFAPFCLAHDPVIYLVYAPRHK